MGVLEALGGWQNVNQEKLEQIKVDNPPLYNAISKALNLLAKKFGGEDIIIQKPIEVVEEVVPTTRQGQLTDYQILKKIEILSETKGDWPNKMEILGSFIYEIGFDENEIVAIGDFQQYLYSKLADLERRNLLLEVIDEYQVSGAGQRLIDSYELVIKQIEEIGPSDEDLKSEILVRMLRAGYDINGNKKLLNQDDIITNGVKNKFDIPPNKYFGLVVKLLGDGFVEKDPSGLTDSIRLTTPKGGAEAIEIASNWSNENLPEEGGEANQYNFPEERQDQVLIAVYDAERNFDRFVTLDEIYNQLLPNLPANYPKSGISGEPTLEKDLQILEGNNLVIRRLMTLPKIGAEYAIDPRQLPLISVLKMKRAKAQKTTSPTTQTPQYNLPQDRLEGILKRLSEARAKIHDYVSIEDLHRQLYDVLVPLNYLTYESKGFPSLEGDLKIMEGMGLVKSRKTIDNTTQTIETEYDIDTKGGDMLTQLKLVEAQQQKASSLRPSPSESATLFPTGTIRFGNDGNQWRVTETKNGVKRWTKVGDIPSDEPVVGEPPISEITEDEVDLDLLEQQLNDDSLEFDLNEEDLDNLEF